jgi:hypothetical protein
MDVSCAGVAPTFTADGGRVPWAGDSEFNEENVRSPKPLVSPSSGASLFAASVGDSVCTWTTDGDVLLADNLALPLVARIVFDAFGAGVRILEAVVGDSASVHRQPLATFAPAHLVLRALASYSWLDHRCRR